jgi:hypothetical protein
MLDLMLQSMYETHEREKTASALHGALMQLPKDELLAIAFGQSPLNKLAYSDGPDGECSWLDQFQGSPMYEQALALEQKCLQIDMQQVQGRAERESVMDQSNQEKDVIRVQKRMLELQLAQSKHQGGGGEGEMPVTPDGVPPPVAETAAPPAAGEGVPVKQAAELTEAARDKIAPKNFALSSKQSGTGKPAYPIEDHRHAANALSRVDQNGSSKEKSEVYSDVARKYPDLARHSSVAGVRDKAKHAGVTPEQLVAMRMKLAFALPGGGNLMQAAKNVGQLGLHMAQKNPTAALGLAGAGVGAMAAGPGNRMKGALGGGVMGAGVGQMPQISGVLQRGANILSR